jgi:hypothetical protein
MKSAVTPSTRRSNTYSFGRSSRTLRCSDAYRVLAKLFSLFAVASTLSTATHAAPHNTAPPIDAYPSSHTASLQVSGNQILFGGTQVRLRGIAMGDVWDYQASGHNLNALYASVARDWKGNVVRLSAHPGAWRDRRVEMLDLLDQHTKAALNHGLFIIITWHSVGYPNGYYQPVDQGSSYSPYNFDSDFELAKEFWATVSSQFNDGRIIFELWNRPAISNDDNGISQWADLKGYWQELTNIIRGNGNNSLLLATGTQWAYNLRGIRDNPLPDANTAYAWQVYANSGNNDPAEWNAALDGLDKIKPIVVTEWGFDPDTTNHYNGTAEALATSSATDFLQHAACIVQAGVSTPTTVRHW